MRMLLLIATLAAGVTAAPVLQAQPDYTVRTSYSVVRCESFGSRPTFCAVDTRRGIRIANDHSGRCQLGRTWGYNTQGVWVAGGCRADFAMERGRDSGWGMGFADKRYVVCASEDYRRRFCPVATGRGVRLVNQISQSACIRGRTWWRDARGIVVDNGCAGEFEVGYREAGYVTPPATGAGGVYRPERFICSARGAPRRYCPADVGFGAVALMRRISGTCEYGRNWGYDRRGVWVSAGCSAEFEVGYPTTDWTPGPGIRHVRCESHDYDRNFCDLPDRTRNVTLQRQLSRAQCIEGRTWGFDRGRLWVDDGCAGDFVLN